MFMEPVIRGPGDFVYVHYTPAPDEGRHWTGIGEVIEIISGVDLLPTAKVLQMMRDHEKLLDDAARSCIGFPNRGVHYLQQATLLMGQLVQSTVETLMREHLDLEDGPGDLDVEIHLDSYEVYLSASGYMDRTDSVICKTLKEAREHLDETYSIVECDEHGWQEFDEGGCPPCQDTKGDEAKDAEPLTPFFVNV